MVLISFSLSILHMLLYFLLTQSQNVRWQPDFLTSDFWEDAALFLQNFFFLSPIILLEYVTAFLW